MCTVVILSRPGLPCPLLLAANRDEMLARAWDKPASYWPDQPDIVAGRDHSGGGTWMGLNSAGVVAAVLNRPGSLGPAPGKRSRGAATPMLVQHGCWGAAVAFLATEPASEYRSFNMVVVDAAGAHFVRGVGEGHVEARPLGVGVH